MQKISFIYNMGPTGGLTNVMPPSHLKKWNPKGGIKTRMVDCFPFELIMKTIGRNHVDLFSLDIEGGEMAVLKTIPLNVISINIFIIEYAVIGDNIATETKLQNLQAFFAKTGLYQVGIVVKPIDVVFVRRDINASII